MEPEYIKRKYGASGYGEEGDGTHIIAYTTTGSW